MTGIITEILDDNIPSSEGRPAIKKIIVIIDFLNEQSAAIEFIGELRRSIIRGFKCNDKVEVEYKTKVHKNRKNKVFNNKIATSIRRV